MAESEQNPEGAAPQPQLCEHKRPLGESCAACLAELEQATKARQAEPPPTDSPPPRRERGTGKHEPGRVDLLAGLRHDSRLRAALERVAWEDPTEVSAQLKAEEQAELDQLDRAIRVARWEAYLANVLGDYRDAAYGKLTPQQDPDGKVTGWWGGRARTLLIAGPSGHGKTVAAHAVTNEVAAADRDAPRGTPRVVVRAWNVATLRQKLSPPEPHQRDDKALSARRERVYEDVLDCHLLLLDDLGREYGRDWWGSVLYEILENRVQDAGNRRTIITMNAVNDAAVGDQVADRYGTPVWTRIRHDAVGAWVQGAEFRQWARSDNLFK